MSVRVARRSGPICLVQPVERTAGGVLILRIGEGSVFQNRRVVGRTTTDGISETYKDSYAESLR